MFDYHNRFKDKGEKCNKFKVENYANESFYYYLYFVSYIDEKQELLVNLILFYDNLFVIY